VRSVRCSNNDFMNWAGSKAANQFDVHFTTQASTAFGRAPEWIASAPELLVVWSNPGLAARKLATQTIPIAFAWWVIPSGAGLD